MKNLLTSISQPCLDCGGQANYQEGGEFQPHMMYNPETGEPVEVASMEEHVALAEQGFLSEEQVQQMQQGQQQQMEAGGVHMQNGLQTMKSNINKHFKKAASARDNMFLKDPKAPQNQSTDEYIGARKGLFTDFVKASTQDALMSQAMDEVTANKEQEMIQMQQQMMNAQGLPMAKYGDNIGQNFGMGNEKDITPWVNEYTNQLQDNKNAFGAVKGIIGSGFQNMFAPKETKLKTKTKFLFGNDEYVEGKDKFDKDGNVRRTTKGKVKRDYFGEGRWKDKKAFKNMGYSKNDQANSLVTDVTYGYPQNQINNNQQNTNTDMKRYNDMLVNPWRQQGGSIMDEQYGGMVDPNEFYYNDGGAAHNAKFGPGHYIHPQDMNEFFGGADENPFRKESRRPLTAQQNFQQNFGVTQQPSGSGNGQWGDAWQPAGQSFNDWNQTGNSGMYYDPNQSQVNSDIIPTKFDGNGNPTAWYNSSTGDVVDAGGNVIQTNDEQLAAAGFQPPGGVVNKKNTATSTTKTKPKSGSAAASVEEVQQNSESSVGDKEVIDETTTTTTKDRRGNYVPAEGEDVQVLDNGLGNGDARIQGRAAFGNGNQYGYQVNAGPNVNLRSASIDDKFRMRMFGSGLKRHKANYQFTHDGQAPWRKDQVDPNAVDRLPTRPLEQLDTGVDIKDRRPIGMDGKEIDKPDSQKSIRELAIGNLGEGDFSEDDILKQMDVVKSIRDRSGVDRTAQPENYAPEPSADMAGEFPLRGRQKRVVRRAERKNDRGIASGRIIEDENTFNDGGQPFNPYAAQDAYMQQQQAMINQYNQQRYGGQQYNDGGQHNDNPWAVTDVQAKTNRGWGKWAANSAMDPILGVLTSIGENYQDKKTGTMGKSIEQAIEDGDITNADNVANAYQEESANRGTWGTNAPDVFRADQMGYPTQFRGYDAGSIGGPAVVQYGGQYQMGGTYEVSEDEVNAILAAGGQIEYL